MPTIARPGLSANRGENVPAGCPRSPGPGVRERHRTFCAERSTASSLTRGSARRLGRHVVAIAVITFADPRSRRRGRPARRAAVVQQLPVHRRARLSPDDARAEITNGRSRCDDCNGLGRGGRRADRRRPHADLTDLVHGGNPTFDLRLTEGHRGRGLGTPVLRELTGFVFDRRSGIARIEGHTREDNVPMRSSSRSGGDGASGSLPARAPLTPPASRTGRRRHALAPIHLRPTSLDPSPSTATQSETTVAVVAASVGARRPRRACVRAPSSAERRARDQAVRHDRAPNLGASGWRVRGSRLALPEVASTRSIQQEHGCADSGGDARGDEDTGLGGVGEPGVGECQPGDEQ